MKDGLEKGMADKGATRTKRAKKEERTENKNILFKTTISRKLSSFEPEVN